MAFIHYILGGKLEIFDKKTKKTGIRKHTSLIVSLFSVL